MLEGLLADLLTSVLGQYVEGINRHSISAEIWGGNLELRGLALKEEALAVFFESVGLVLPVTVQAGIIGLLRVQVPWKNLGSQPCKIVMEHMTVIARPVVNDGSSANEVHRREMRLKRARLNQDNAVREVSLNILDSKDSKENAKSNGTWASAFTNRLMSRVLDNLQIELHDFVVRFEDATSDPQSPYAASFHLHSVKAVSTDATWNQRFLDDDASKAIHKVVELKGLVIDWAPLNQYYERTLNSEDAAHKNSTTSSSDLRRLALESNFSGEEVRDDHMADASPQQILLPVNGMLRATMQKPWGHKNDDEILHEESKPSSAVDLDFKFPQFALEINEVQYTSLLQTSNYFARLATRGFRPQDGKEWWVWSMEQILPGFTKRHREKLCLSTQGLIRRRAEREKYIAARVSILKGKYTGIDIVQSLSKEIDAMEKKLSFSDIMLYRDLADDRVLEEIDSWERESTPESSGTSNSVFWSLLGYGSATSSSKAEVEEVQKTVVEHGELEDRRNAHNKETLAVRIGFLLQETSVKTFKGGFPSKAVPIMELTFSRLHVGASSSHHNGITVEILLGSLAARDLEKGTGLIYPRIQSACNATVDADAASGGNVVEESYPQGVSQALDSIRSGHETFTFTERQENENEGTISKGGQAVEKDTKDDDCNRLGYIAAICLSQNGGTADCNTGSESGQLSLDVAIGRLEVVLDGPSGALLRGLKFWQPKSKSQAPVFSLLGAAAGARIAQIRVELERAVLEEGGPMQVNIVIHAPRFIVPSGDPTTDAVVVNLGTLALATSRNQDIDCEVSASASTRTRVRYTTYKVELVDVGVYVAPSIQKAKSMSPFHDKNEEEQVRNEVQRVITPVSIRFEVRLLQDAKMVEVAGFHRDDDSQRLAKFKISGKIPNARVVLSQLAYRGMLKVAKSWQSTSTASTSDKIDVNVVKPMPGFNDPHSSSPVVALASVDVSFSIDEISVELVDERQSGIVLACATGMHVGVTKKGRSELSVEFRLARWSVLEGEQNSDKHFRKLAHAGARMDDEEYENPEECDAASETEDEKSFVYCMYKMDLMRHRQHITLRIRSLNLLCKREIYVKLGAFFYRKRSAKRVASKDSESSSGNDANDEYQDPFAILGSSTSEAAANLVANTENAVGNSASAIASQGEVQLEALFDGLSLTLVAADAPVAKIEMRKLGCAMKRSSDGVIDASGDLEYFAIEDLTTPLKLTSSVASYTRPVNQNAQNIQDASATHVWKEGWMLTFPNDGKTGLAFSANLQGLKLTHTSRFIDLIRRYFESLLTALEPALRATKAKVTTEKASAGSSQPSISTQEVQSSSAGYSYSVLLKDSEVVIPRNSKCAHESLLLALDSMQLKYDPRSLDSLNLNFEGMSATVNYVGEEESLGSVTAKEPVLAKVAGELAISSSQDGATDPKLYLDPLCAHKDASRCSTATKSGSFSTAHLTVSRGASIFMCEAQYSVLYFILTENFIEKSDASLTNLDVDTERDNSNRCSHASQCASGQNRTVEREGKVKEDVDIDVMEEDDLSLQFSFNFAQVEMTVVRGELLSIESNYLLLVKVASLVGKVDMFQSSTVQVDAGGDILGAFGFATTGSPREANRPLLSPRTDARDRKLLVSYKMVPFTPAEVTLLVPPLQILYLSDLIRQLGCLTVPGSPYLPSSEDAPPCPYLGRTISISVSNSRILFPDSPHGDAVSTMRVMGSFTIRLLYHRDMDGKSYSLETKNLTVDIIEKLKHSNRQSQMLYPCNVNIEYCMPRLDRGAADRVFAIRGELGDVTCRIDGKDLAVLIACLPTSNDGGLSGRPMQVVEKTRGSICDEEEKAKDKKETLPVETRTNLSLNIWNGRIILDDDSLTHRAPLLEVRMKSCALKGTLPWVLSISTFCGLECFNQTKGWWEPVVEAFGAELTYNQGKSGSRAISVSCTDPLNINVTPAIVRGVHRALDSAEKVISSTMSARCDSDVASKHKKLAPTDTDKGTSKLDMDDVQDLNVTGFCFCNELGVDVLLWGPQGESYDTVASGDKVEIPVLSNDAIKEKADAVADENRVRENLYRCSVSLRGKASAIALSAGQSIVNCVRLKEQGFAQGASSTSSLTDQVAAVWEVEMVAGVPRGTLRSLVRVYNNTKVPLEICTRGITGDRDEVVTELGAGKYYNLPKARETDAIKVRPHLDPLVLNDGDSVRTGASQETPTSAWEWSDTLPSLAVLRSVSPDVSTLERGRGLTLSATGSMPSQDESLEVKMKYATCKSGQDREIAFVVAVDGQTGKQPFAGIGAADVNNSAVDIILNPPITISNMLPAPVVMQIACSQRQDSKILLQKTVKASDEAHIHNIDQGLNNLGINVCLEAENRGTSVEKLSLRELHSIMSISGRSIRGSKGGSLVALEPDPPMRSKSFRKYTPLRGRIVRRTNCTSYIKLSLEADYWIRNRSDVPLLFLASTAYHVETSIPHELHAAPPGTRADPYIPFTGPYVSFKRLSSNGSKDEEDSATSASLIEKAVSAEQNSEKGPIVSYNSWWDCPHSLKDLDKPISIILPGVSLTMDVRPATGKYRGANIVTIRNAVWIVNRTDHQLQWCQPAALDSHGIVRSKYVHTVPQRGVQSVQWDFSQKPKHLSVRILKVGETQSDWIWSRAIPTAAGDKAEVAVKMYQPKTYQQYIARVVTMNRPGNSVALVVYPEDRKHPPYRIVNLCERRSIAFKQSGNPGRPWLVRPTNSTRYTWDNPLEAAEKRKLIIEVIEPAKRTNPGESSDQDEYHHPEFNLSIDVVTENALSFAETFHPPLQVEVKVEGPTKIVSFFDKPLPSEKAAPVVAWDDLDTKADKASAIPPASNRKVSKVAEVQNTGAENKDDAAIDVDISLRRVGVSLVDRNFWELAFIAMDTVHARYEAFESTQIYSINVNKLQIDNQLPQPPYPVMLWAAPVGASSSDPGSSSEPSNSSLQRESDTKMLAVQITQTSTVGGISMYKGVYAAIQPINIALDEELIWRLQAFAVELSQSRGAEVDEHLEGNDPEQESLLSVVPMDLGEEIGPDMLRMYVEELVFYPVQVCVSFATSRGVSESNSAGFSGGLRTLLAILGNVENCGFEFPKLELHHVFDTHQHFNDLVKTYYYTLMDNQKLKLVSSNALVGNPAALFDSISVGARDLFIEPGRAKDSEEFLACVGRGSRSLFSNTVGGIVGSLGGIPKAMATGLESAVGDKEYLNERRLIRKQSLGGGMSSNSSSATQGLVTGARSFGHGIASGVKGLILDPARGAKNDGMSGFFRGVGSGLAGSILKPVAGALDLVGEPAAGIRSSVSVSRMRRKGIVAPEPSRPPRPFEGPDQRLRSYNLHVAIGYTLLRAPTVASSSGASDRLLAWVELSDRSNRKTLAGLEFAWTIIRRHLRNMPGARKLLQAEMRENDKKEKKLMRVSRPEKTRVCLITNVRLIICTWDGQLLKQLALKEVLDIRTPQGTTDQLIVNVGNRRNKGSGQLRSRPSAVYAMQCGSRGARDDVRIALDAAMKKVLGVCFDLDPIESSKEIPLVDMTSLETTESGQELARLNSRGSSSGSWERRSLSKSRAQSGHSQRDSTATGNNERTGERNKQESRTVTQKTLSQLLELGFSREASIQALNETNGDIVRAVDRLLGNRE